MQNFKIAALLLLIPTDSGGYVKFTPKYIMVGVKGGLRIFVSVQTYSFGHLGPHAKCQNCSFTPSGLFLVSVRRRIC